MTITSLGIQVPSDYDHDAEPIAVEFNDDTEMTFEIHESSEGFGYLIGSSHEAVGLVSWLRADNLADAEHWVEGAMQEGVDDE